MKKNIFIYATVFLTAFSTWVLGQTRDEQVHNDRNKLLNNEDWFYDDFDKGIKEAEKTGKPLMVVLRCIP